MTRHRWWDSLNMERLAEVMRDRIEELEKENDNLKAIINSLMAEVVRLENSIIRLNGCIDGLETRIARCEEDGIVELERAGWLEKSSVVIKPPSEEQRKIGSIEASKTFMPPKED